MKKILITGFEDFADESPNSSSILVNKLTNWESLILPVSFATSFQVFKKKYDEYKPDIVLHFGVSPKRLTLSIERIGINVMDARLPDNDDFQPRNSLIETDGEDGLFSTIPVNDIAGFFIEKRIPTEISNTAGSYVCNYLMYRSLYMSKNTNTQSGFIHLPSVKHVSVDKYVNSMDEMIKKLCESTLDKSEHSFGRED